MLPLPSKLFPWQRNPHVKIGLHMPFSALKQHLQVVKVLHTGHGKHMPRARCVLTDKTVGNGSVAGPSCLCLVLGTWEGWIQAFQALFSSPDFLPTAFFFPREHV